MSQFVISKAQVQRLAGDRNLRSQFVTSRRPDWNAKVRSKRHIVSTSAAQIEQQIYIIRGQRVMLDIDLAGLYRVPTKRLNEQVRRNRDRFPPDFAFHLTLQEFTNLKSQIATSSWGYGPFGFNQSLLVSGPNSQESIP
jgi:hypothetical protein